MESKKRSLSSDGVEADAGSSPKEMKLANQVEESSIEEDESYSLDFEKVIGIEKIFKVLEEMLNYKDLKSLRLVSKKCEEVVLRHQFVDKTNFIVRDKTFNTRVLDHMRFKPMHIEIYQFLGVSFEESAANSLPKDVSLVKLNKILGYRVMKDGVSIWSIEEMKPLAAVSENIHTLHINRPPPYVGEEDRSLRVFPPTKNLLATAKSLTCLRFFCFDGAYTEAEEDPRVDKPSVAVPMLYLAGPCKGIDECVTGFKNIRNLTYIIIASDSDLEPDDGSGSYCSTLRQLMQENGNTIEWIHLTSMSGFRTKGPEIFTILNLTERTFPKLRYFKTSFFVNEITSLQNFISSHISKLEQLDLVFTPDHDSYEPFPTRMQRFLEELKPKKSTLCIKETVKEEH